MTALGPCALCGSSGPLLNSHLIPKFTVEWLKKTSATGYLRMPVSPNLRRQDGPTKRLLCSSCEELFSVDEAKFAQKFWVPYQENNVTIFEYDEWLRRFAISLAWRTVTTQIENFRRSNPERTKLIVAADEALLLWKAYLLGQSVNPGPYEHHLLLVNHIIVPEDERFLFPDRGLHYLRRAFDLTLAGNSVLVFAYTKLPGMIFYSAIRPTKPVGWQGTRIAKKGTITAGQVGGAERFGAFIEGRVKMISQINISEKQRARINEDMMKNPDRTALSDSFQTHLLEQELRGLLDLNNLDLDNLDLDNTDEYPD